jgi:hypothetical protein
MEFCPIDGYQVIRVFVSIGKFYKVRVFCVDDFDECHILLWRPWQVKLRVYMMFKEFVPYFTARKKECNSNAWRENTSTKSRG